MIQSPLRLRFLGRFGAFAALALLGCHSLDGFDTKPGYAYCGPIIGVAPFQAGFVPLNQPPSLWLALTLNTSNLTSVPGYLTSNDTANGLCSASGQPLFQGAPLRAIPEVDNDVLSTLSFGEGHEHDFFAWVDSTCQGTMVAVVSLMKNDQVELRLFKPARQPPPDAGPAEIPGFAVFHLAPRLRSTPENPMPKGGCGF